MQVDEQHAPSETGDGVRDPFLCGCRSLFSNPSVLQRLDVPFKNRAETTRWRRSVGGGASFALGDRALKSDGVCSSEIFLGTIVNARIVVTFRSAEKRPYSARELDSVHATYPSSSRTRPRRSCARCSNPTPNNLAEFRLGRGPLKQGGRRSLRPSCRVALRSALEILKHFYVFADASGGQFRDVHSFTALWTGLEETLLDLEELAVAVELTPTYSLSNASPALACCSFWIIAACF